MRSHVSLLHTALIGVLLILAIAVHAQAGDLVAATETVVTLP